MYTKRIALLGAACLLALILIKGLLSWSGYGLRYYAGAQSVSVNGVVTDGAGMPVANVQIVGQWTPVNGDRRIEVVGRTDAYGRFSLPGVPNYMNISVSTKAGKISPDWVAASTATTTTPAAFTLIREDAPKATFLNAQHVYFTVTVRAGTTNLIADDLLPSVLANRLLVLWREGPLVIANLEVSIHNGEVAPSTDLQPVTLPQVWVPSMSGKDHGSGACYFRLRDASAVGFIRVRTFKPDEVGISVSWIRSAEPIENALREGSNDKI